MERPDISTIISNFILNQREVNYLFRKDYGLNRYQMEILTFASSTLAFNPYNVQQRFRQMNLQQVRVSIKKLQQLKLIEMITPGVKGKPAVYLLSKAGLNVNSYRQFWESLLSS